MHSPKAIQERSTFHHRLVLIGLSAEERQLVQGAAIREWYVLAGDCLSASGADVPKECVIMTIASLDAIEACSAQSSPPPWLSRWSGVVLIPADTSAARQQWLAHTAPGARLVLTGLPNSVRALSRALCQVRHEAVATALATLVDFGCSPQVSRVLRAALFLEPSSAHIPALAQSLHMHERTLRKKLVPAGCSCAPQRLLGWARVLHAAWYLRDASISVERVADWLRFSAASNLHRMMRSYAGTSVRDLRRHGDPLAFLVEQMRIDLAAEPRMRDLSL